MCDNRQGNYKYAGLQGGSYCFCGTTYNKYGGSSACGSPCSGDPTSVCGGVLKNSILFLGGEIETVFEPDKLCDISTNYLLALIIIVLV